MKTIRSAIRKITISVSMLFILGCPWIAEATDWSITATVHEIQSLTDDDADGPDDFYAITDIITTVGTPSISTCNRKPGHPDDNNHIFPDWACVHTATGGSDTTVQVNLKVFDHDTTSADDHFDSHSHESVMDIAVAFKPATNEMRVDNLPGWETYRCANRVTAFGTDGDDRAKVVLSVTASLLGTPDGDSDNDGLTDSEELCGIDSNGDGIVDIDLPAMGANPYRKDIFVELDWMIANTHTHEPWLPALIKAWNEFDQAPVTNPTINGIETPSGIALHVDVGMLYANHQLNFDGNGPNELTVGADGNFDVNNDEMPDIGNLGALGNGTAGGGNRLAETPNLFPVPGSNPPDFFDTNSSFRTIKNNNFNPIRDGVFRYVVFAHQYGFTSSSGLAECANGEPPCNDSIVSLGGWDRQTLDVNRDSVPDLGTPPLLGPAGLPVDGTVAQHVGTFLHELGHTMTLGHGGGDSINNKPNYLSVMNYLWQIPGVSFDTDGDGMADQIGRDDDGDGVNDLSRYIYSQPALATLNEGSLNEAVGIQDNNALTTYACSGATNSVGSGTGWIDWDCDGLQDIAPVSVDVNNDGVNTSLVGFDDYQQIANGGLLFQDQAPGISLNDLRKQESKTKRILELKNEKGLRNRCQSVKEIDFNDHPSGTVIDHQYSPTVTFLSDSLRTPVIAETRPDDSNTMTHSPNQYLRNKFSSPIELDISFGALQRQVGLYFGMERPVAPTDIVMLKAFDRWDNPMGTIIRKKLSPTTKGINRFLGIGAIFGDQLIKRITLKYDTPEGNTAVAIDDLLICEQIKTGESTPPLPIPPKFGDLPVTITVQTSMISITHGGDTENGHNETFIEQPVVGIPVSVNGSATASKFSVNEPEGTDVSFIAPGAYTVGSEILEFLYWKFNENIFFSDGKKEISFPLLHNATVTAVYGGNRYRRVVALEKERKEEQEHNLMLLRDLLKKRLLKLQLEP